MIKNISRISTGILMLKMALFLLEKCYFFIAFCFYLSYSNSILQIEKERDETSERYQICLYFLISELFALTDGHY